MIMLKKLTLLLCLSFSVFAQNIELKEFHFISENDGDFGQDNDYTFGSEIGALFLLPYEKDTENNYYFSLTYDWQMYTPKDLQSSDIILDDRPYAGYQYIKTSIHQANKTRVQNLSLQLGFIGPATHMQQVQNTVHSLIGSPHANGWEHQLKNEFIVQLNYSYRKFIPFNQSNVLLPEMGFELGNASVKGYAMVLYRWGNDVKSDFGTSLMSNTNYYKIPRMQKSKKKWRYSLQLSLQTNFIARDIFLDGNTIQNSHSVEKKNFTAEFGYGANLSYKNWNFSYLRKHLTKEFDTQNRYHNYGSLTIGYDF